MFSLLKKFFEIRAEENEKARMHDPIYSLLRREVTRVGKKFESMPTYELMNSDEVLSFDEVIDGVKVSFRCGCFNIKPNGDVGFCIDVTAKPNKTGSQPSYQFYKSESGEVYY